MPNTDFTTIFLEMEDAVIERVENEANKIVVHLHLKRRPHTCPQCKAITDRVHDYRLQTIKDLPVLGKPLLWKLRKRRYTCPCCHKHFQEQNCLLPKFHRITNRLALYALKLLGEKRSCTDIAASLGVSTSSVLRWLQLASVDPPKKLPPVLSIDEFRGNVGNEKFQCILTDPLHRRILDILPGRQDYRISSYLRSFPPAEREKVKYVVMDMNKAYLTTMKDIFPKANIIIDRFHVVRQCVWAIENVRKRIQKNLPKEQRRYFKRSRKLLLAHMQKLSPESKEALNVMLAFSDDLTKAYLLKELFYNFMAASDRQQAARRLLEFRLQAHIAELKEFEPVMTMLFNWEPYLLNIFDCPFSNGFTEGCNNKIKVLKRIAFGYRNFEHLRKRIILSFRS